MIKILHFADVHLDSPFSLCDIKRSEQRRNELRSAFTSVMTYVRTSKIKYVLIPGDLFDYNFVTRETIDLVLREFEANRETNFIIAPGNHDPYTPDSVWATVSFPENVFIFKSSELSAFEFPEDGVDIYGYAFTSSSLDTCPVVGNSIKNPGRINLLLGHADTSSAISKYCPINEHDIVAFGADYTALGHIHNTDGLHNLPSGAVYAYSGCLEGRSFDECGHKGAILIDVSRDEHGAKKVTPRPYRFSHRRYMIENIDISTAATADDVLDMIKDKIHEKRYGDDTTLRVILTGNTAPNVLPDTAFISNQLTELFGIEVLDRSLPLYDDEFLRSDISIRGEFYRTMLPKLTTGDPRERELAAWALRYGLSALAGENIIDF